MLADAGAEVISHLRRRLELLAVEITEEELRFARVLGWQLLALFLTCLTLAVAVAMLLAAFWETEHRMRAMGFTLFACAAAALATWWMYRRHVTTKPIVFTQTIEELRRDVSAIGGGSAAANGHGVPRGNGAVARAHAAATGRPPGSGGVLGDGPGL